MLIYGSQTNLSKKLDKWKFFGWFVKQWSKRVGFLKKVSCFIKFLRLVDAQNSSKQLLVISGLNSLITADVAYIYPSKTTENL